MRTIKSFEKIKSINNNEPRNSPSFSYFNENYPKNDSREELEGAVYYVQNSIIPARKNILDDVQPDIIENRKLMVLFTPQEGNVDVINLKVKNIRNGIDVSRTFKPRNDRLPLALQPEVSGNVDFSIPGDFDITIDNDSKIKEISNDINAFENIISKNSTIKIITSDGNYSGQFTLRFNKEFSGKKILFICNSGYAFDVIRPRLNSMRMSRGDSYLFTNDNGNWLTENDLQYALIRYMKNCWYTFIPAEIVKPGMKLEFSTGNEAQGVIGVIDNIAVGAPNQLLLHTISIGMLTPYRENFEFQANPEYHRQYFQHIPVSQLIVSAYDPVYLIEVMLPDGQLLTDTAPDNGGTHTGSMREYIGKHLISQGINYANYGYTSSKAEDTDRQMIAGQISIHLSVGKYKNGVQIHGFSGGAGMVTLSNSLGNEFSHELAHNYGLGHYPGGFYGSVAQIPSVRNSTWGWDSDKTFFIPNFQHVVTNKPTFLEEAAGETLFAPPFQGHSLGRDAMAGGEPFYPEANAFTLHTPYVLSVIQKYLESKAIFDRTSPTGFSIWNAQLKKMEPYKLINNGIDFFTMPVYNGVDITASEINKYLKNYINVLIVLRDGQHARFVYLPDADQNNNGLVVKFEINSGYSVTVKINGTEEILNKGTIKSYISNGKSWIISDSELENASIVPYKQGVKVITLVGFYDPEGKLTSYIYPALNGSYGNIYHYSKRSRCYLVIEYVSGKKFSYALAPFRYKSDEMNKFHINVERDLEPTILRLYIDDKLIIQRAIELGSDNLSYTVNGTPLA